MFMRLRSLWNAYPRQFWLMFWGMLLSTIGTSMIWPFLTIYVSERLDVPLTVVGSLLTLNSAMGLVTSLIAGPIIDRLGRKWGMVAGLSLHGCYYLLMGRADSLLEFALLMGIGGSIFPVYRVAADSMLADLIPPEQRSEAYALLRTSNNLGVAIGPAAGGLIAATSYNLVFLFGAAGLITYSILITLFAVETLPRSEILAERGTNSAKPPRERLGGYGRVLRDTPFSGFVVNFMLVEMSAVLVWILLGVYVKHNYGISERQFGLLPTTNALMVVFLQVAVTRLTKRRPALLMLALGSLFYAFGVGGMALGEKLWWFWICMVVMTLGELILAPTASTYVANLAPADMRGRYMSLFGMTWSVAAGGGAVLGGLLNDNLGPRAIWYGGGLLGLVGAAAFLLFAQRQASRNGSRQSAPG